MAIYIYARENIFFSLWLRSLILIFIIYLWYLWFSDLELWLFIFIRFSHHLYLFIHVSLASSIYSVQSWSFPLSLKSHVHKFSRHQNSASSKCSIKAQHPYDRLKKPVISVTLPRFSLALSLLQETLRYKSIRLRESGENSKTRERNGRRRCEDIPASLLSTLFFPCLWDHGGSRSWDSH